MTARAAVLLLCIGILAACTPRIIPADTPITRPSLNGDSLRMADGALLPLRVWRPAGRPTAVILALHGFNDYSRAFEEPAAFWAKRGIVTYAYDQRGFGDAPYPGRWAGVDTLINDLAVASRLVRHSHPGIPFIVLGESMGGAVIMVALASATPPGADGVILSAPAIWSRETMPLWQRIGLAVLSHTVPGMKVSGRGLGKVPSDNIAMLRKLSRDPKVIKRTRIDAIYGLVNLMDAALAAAPTLRGDTLMLYGKREDIIPDGARRALEARLPRDACNLRLAEYDSGYHMLLRDLMAERVLTDVAAWVGNRRTALPSGAERPLMAAAANLEEGDGVGTKLALNCGAPARTARP
jgi:alpha-beta hydrolase superfamily lysophospholipase